MRTFLIAPVRGVAPDRWAKAVEELVAFGYEVYWPARDTNQDDNTGYDICRQNCLAMMQADRVHVIWDGASQGCLFDLGMAFALDKPIRVIYLPPDTKGKSFQNMVHVWADRSA